MDEPAPTYAHPPITWRVDFEPLPTGLGVTAEALASAQLVAVEPFPDDLAWDRGTRDGSQVTDELSGADRAAVNLQVAMLEVGPLLVVGAVTLTSSLGHQHHALACVRDGTYWAVYRDHNAKTWVSLQLSGDKLETVSPLPA